ncbi:MAG: hypothetical protein KAX50_03580 [Saprospiraceae bacterium]|nr:hypothetical protein [Saprospiraceae bacterium]
MENLKILLKGWPIVLLCGALAWWAAKKYLNYAVPMYESTTKIRLADVNEGVPGQNLYKDMDVFAGATKIAAEIEVMKSKIILDKVINKLSPGYAIYRKGKLRSTELFGDSPIAINWTGSAAPLYRKTFLLTVADSTSFTLAGPDGVHFSGRIGETVEVFGVQMVLSLNPQPEERQLKIADTYLLEFTDLERAASALQSQLDITAVDKDVPVVRISYRSSHPHKAAAVVNAIAQHYIEDYIRLKYESADMTSDFLQNQIGQVAGQLSQSEDKIQGYRDQNNIINVRQETETDLRKISQLKIQQTSLRMSLDAVRELNEYLRSGQSNFLELAPNFEAFTDLLSTEMVKKIKELQSEKKDLLLTYTPADERVQVVDRKIKDYADYLRESVRNTLKNLETKYALLSRDIEAAEQVFVGLPEKEKLLTIMDRDFELYQSSYIFLNNKKIEADIAKAAKSSFHRILQPATASLTPVAPNGTIITIVATLLGLLAGLVIIALLHYWRPKVRSLNAIETRTAIPVAYTAPFLKTAAERSRFFTKTSISLQVKNILAPHSAVCFSSFHDREGRAFQVLQLAEQLARQGQKVGIADLAGDFTDAPQLPAGVELIQIAGANLSAAGESMERLRQQFDLLLINNENLQDHSVALMFMSLADSNIFVMDSLCSKLDTIGQFSLLAKEHELPYPYIAFNREGYEPGALPRIIRIARPRRQKQMAS